jgi:hypothetical protein
MGSIDWVPVVPGMSATAAGCGPSPAGWYKTQQTRHPEFREPYSVVDIPFSTTSRFGVTISARMVGSW